MRLLFLGTAAADWSMEKPKDGSEFRRRSSLLIDDVLLIDPGPQVISACEDFDKDISKIKYMINTHNHDDHFDMNTVTKLEEAGATFIDLKDKDEVKVGRYTIRAYRGNHGTCMDTVHFIVSDGEKSIFYGLDGAWLLYDEVCAIQEHKPDFAVLDATIGDIDGDYRIFEHNNLEMVLEMQKTLKPYIAQFCISHMAYTLHSNHETLAKMMEEYDIITAYDGLELEI